MTLENVEDFIRFALHDDRVSAANRATMRLDYYRWHVRRSWEMRAWMRAYRKVQADYRERERATT